MRAAGVASGTAPAAGAAWPDIGDYGLIGDCRTAALVGRDGGIDWLCLPHFSSPAYFARLLDRERGGPFTVSPADPYRSERQYLRDSNVLQTRFQVAGGELRMTDAMTIPCAGNDGLLPQRELLRCIEAVDGDVALEVTYAPRPDYGRSPVRLTRQGRLGWACTRGSDLLMLHTGLELEPLDDGRTLRGRLTLPRGELPVAHLCLQRHSLCR